MPEYIEVKTIQQLSWQTKYGVMIGIGVTTYMAMSIPWMVNTLGAVAFVAWWLFAALGEEYARFFNTIALARYINEVENGTLSDDDGLKASGEDDNDQE